MRPLRYQPTPRTTWFVTTRCMQSRFLLRPSPRLNDRIVGVLGRANEKHEGVELHAVVVMSNHMHMLLSSESAVHLSEWMNHVNSNIARIAGAENDWEGPFWARPYSAEACLDQAAVLGRLGYILRHGTKEKLVKRPEDWPGLNCVEALRRGKPLTGTWYNETLRGKKRARGRSLHRKDHTTSYTVALTPPPALEHLSPSAYRKEIERLRSDAITEGETLRCGAPALGAKRILAEDPKSAPDAPKRSPRPRCHSTDPELRDAFLEGYRAAVEAYRAAIASLREGVSSFAFPAGMIPPATSLACAPSG